MCAARQRVWGVITGDVIRSRELGAPDHRRMTRAISGIGEFITKSGFAVTSHAVIRGDSFQLILQDTASILRIALLIRAYMRGLDLEEAPSPDVRIGIGIGPVEFKAKSQHESDGTAYRNASIALEQVRKQTIANMRIITTDPALDNHLNAIQVAWEPILSRWTNAQAKTMQRSLQGMTHQDIAKKLKVSQPTVTRSLQSADDKVIQYLLNYCRELIMGSPSTPPRDR